MRFETDPLPTGRYYESLTISMDIRRYDILFMLAWENTLILFPIITGAFEQAIREIEENIRRHPRDVNILAEASHFYLANNGDPDKALSWLNSALMVREDRWVYHQKIDLLEKLQRFDAARETAAAAIKFLERETPDHDGWHHSIGEIRQQMQRWP